VRLHRPKEGRTGRRERRRRRETKIREMEIKIKIRIKLKGKERVTRRKVTRRKATRRRATRRRPKQRVLMTKPRRRELLLAMNTLCMLWVLLLYLRRICSRQACWNVHLRVAILICKRRMY